MVAPRLPIALALAVAAVMPAAARADQPAAGPAKPLTTPVWREPPPPFNPVWQLLALPERMVELAFTPFALAVNGFERYRLDRRIYDLLRNDAGTIVLTPRAKFALGDGLGLGAELEFRRIGGTDGELGLGGLARLNGDYEIDTEYDQTFAWLEGRKLRWAVEYELDQDLPYFGIGDETDEEHLLENRQLRGLFDAELTPLGATGFISALELAYLRDQLGTGKASASGIPVEPGGDVTLPPGFDQTNHYGRIAARLLFDTRDTEGLSTRGLILDANLAGTISLNGEPLSAVRGMAYAQYFLQVAPLNRVIVLSAGLGGVTPLRGDDEVPLHELITLGRKDFLRGYNRGRFRDNLGWWTSAEYRFLAWEYQDTRVSLVPAFFVDAGNTGGDVGEAVSTVHYDAGLSFRGEYPTKFLFAFELGFSPEGYELGVQIGKEL